MATTYGVYMTTKHLTDDLLFELHRAVDHLDAKLLRDALAKSDRFALRNGLHDSDCSCSGCDAAKVARQVLRNL